jgi:hypothetical protein
LNDLRNPKLQIHDAENRPRVELPQPLLKKNMTEVMLGLKADDAMKVRVRAFLDARDLSHVPVTAAGTSIVASNPSNDD